MNLFSHWLVSRATRSGGRVSACGLSRILLLGACVLGCSGVQAQTRNLYDVFENMEGAPWSAVEQVAQQQATGTLGPVHRNIPIRTPFYAVFEGAFFPASDSTQLAIFSDDGCNVIINGQLVWSGLNRGQHLPNLKQSLHPIPFDLVAGRRYDIRVEYSNIIYRGTTDADGATLFAYTYDENPNRPYVGWLVGQPISCAGIRWPAAGEHIQKNTVGTFRAFGATDWDVLQSMTQGLVISRDLADSCTYSWTATSGSFVLGNGASTGTVGSGPSVQWRAPNVSAPTSVTITLVVDDRSGANMGAGETGTRNDAARGYNDAARGYNDDPLRFRMTVQVDP